MLAINSFVDAGRFQVLDVLGKGGSGIAYLAIDTHSSPKHPKYYAIKCVPRPANDADTSSLLREIRLHKLVSQHPAIVTLKRCIQEGPYQLFIMDFMPGGDLFKQITQQRSYLSLLVLSLFQLSLSRPCCFRLSAPPPRPKELPLLDFSYFALRFHFPHSINLLPLVEYKKLMCLEPLRAHTQSHL